MLGTDFGEFVHRDDHAALPAELESLLSGSTATCSLELRCTRPDRGVVTVALNASFFSATDEDAPCLIFQVQDITARRIAESRLQHIAHHDDLTDLPNRAYFFEQLAGAIKTTRKDPRFRFAVLFLDCDRFKTINDSLGHRAGDELLVVLGKRIAAQLRPSDVIARLGGDEFAILARNMREEDAIVLATRLQSVVAEPVHIRSAELSTSVSIGITMGGPQYASPEDVMRDADIAMYRAKAQGRAQYAMFDTALHAEVSSQLWLESALRRAIEQEQLYLAYQPIFDLRTRQMRAVEALCRWVHAERGADSARPVHPRGRGIRPHRAAWATGRWSRRAGSSRCGRSPSRRRRTCRCTSTCPARSSCSTTSSSACSTSCIAPKCGPSRSRSK